MRIFLLALIGILIIKPMYGMNKEIFHKSIHMYPQRIVLENSKEELGLAGTENETITTYIKYIKNEKGDHITIAKNKNMFCKVLAEKLAIKEDKIAYQGATEEDKYNIYLRKVTKEESWIEHNENDIVHTMQHYEELRDIIMNNTHLILSKTDYSRKDHEIREYIELYKIICKDNKFTLHLINKENIRAGDIVLGENSVAHRYKKKLTNGCIQDIIRVCKIGKKGFEWIREYPQKERWEMGLAFLGSNEEYLVLCTRDNNEIRKIEILDVSHSQGKVLYNLIRPNIFRELGIKHEDFPPLDIKQLLITKKEIGIIDEYRSKFNRTENTYAIFIWENPTCLQEKLFTANDFFDIAINYKTYYLNLNYMYKKIPFLIHAFKKSALNHTIQQHK